MEEYKRLCRWEDNIKYDLKQIFVVVIMETIWKNTGGLVDGRTILNSILKK